MKIISFNWVTPALLAGAKTVTRRHWADRHAEAFKEGDLVQAWDKLPRVPGAKRIAIIELTRDPYKEASILMDHGDYANEGLLWLSLNPRLVPPEMMKMLAKDGYGKLPQGMWEWFLHWRQTGGALWVIRFKVIEYVRPGQPESLYQHRPWASIDFAGGSRVPGRG